MAEEVSECEKPAERANKVIFQYLVPSRRQQQIAVPGWTFWNGNAFRIHQLLQHVLDTVVEIVQQGRRAGKFQAGQV